MAPNSGAGFLVSCNIRIVKYASNNNITHSAGEYCCILSKEKIIVFPERTMNDRGLIQYTEGEQRTRYLTQDSALKQIPLPPSGDFPL